MVDLTSTIIQVPGMSKKKDNASGAGNQPPMLEIPKKQKEKGK